MENVLFEARIALIEQAGADARLRDADQPRVAAADVEGEMTGLQLAVLAILDNATNYEWSVQGFGVLRLYIRRVGRLHVWDSALRYPNVSMIHNHSWDLRSDVVFGHLQNTRYNETSWLPGMSNPEPFCKQRLVTGYKTHMVSPVEHVELSHYPVEIYLPGDVYQQRAHEIHCTNAADGTVTLMARNEDENGQADVYWPRSGTWGTAKPRPATREEIEATVAKVLVTDGPTPRMK